MFISNFIEYKHSINKQIANIFILLNYEVILISTTFLKNENIKPFST